jgi:hypothetical protein
MQVGEIWVVDKPPEERLGGRKFRLVSYVNTPIPRGRGEMQSMWTGVDVDNGEEHQFIEKHFGTLLKPA